MTDPARKAVQNRQSHVTRKLALASPPPVASVRLTASAKAASVIRCPQTGRALKPNSPEGAKWLKL